MKKHIQSFVIVGVYLLAWILVGLVGQHFQQTAHAQAPSKTNSTPVPFQCEKFYNSSMDYLKQVEKGPGGSGVNFDNFNATKSAMYGIAYQNCVARGGK